MPGTTNVIAGEGTILSYSSDGGTTYTDIAQLLSITPPGISRGSVKKTSLGDSAQRFRGGKIPDYGEATFSIEYDTAVHSALVALVESSAALDWKISFNGDEYTTHGLATFTAFISDFKPSELADETNSEADLTLKVDGAVVWTAGS